jgi:hypothetical protein
MDKSEQFYRLMSKSLEELTQDPRVTITRFDDRGYGVVASTFLPKGSKFVASHHEDLTDKSLELSYSWFKRPVNELISGIGFLCNGSCEYFKNLNCSQLGKYKVMKYNIVRADKSYVFTTIVDIYPGQELILDYGDQYFADAIYKHKKDVELRNSLSNLKNNLQAAPRSTKEDFNKVAQYFLNLHRPIKIKGHNKPSDLKVTKAVSRLYDLYIDLAKNLTEEELGAFKVLMEVTGVNY